jgi:hypothetical protein
VKENKVDFWKAGPDVMNTVKRLIADYHPHLALVEDEIAVVFKDKATEKCGLVIPGNTKKAPPLMRVLTDKKFDYKFIVEIGANAWNEFDDKQRQALLDHHLCAMKVEEDSNSGELKCSIRPPDFVGYKEEVERHGMWRPMDDDTLSIIEEMFGQKAEEHSAEVRKRAADAEDLNDVLDVLGGDDDAEG